MQRLPRQTACLHLLPLPALCCLQLLMAQTALGVLGAVAGVVMLVHHRVNKEEEPHTLLFK